jgi:hypothetical protein
MAISHAGHNHPATPAGRAACRKSMAAGSEIANAALATDRVQAKIRAARISHKNCNHAETSHANRQCRADREFATRTVAPITCTINAKHCEQCGQVNPGAHEGYTACCNELISYSAADCRNHHR